MMGNSTFCWRRCCSLAGLLSRRAAGDAGLCSVLSLLIRRENGNDGDDDDECARLGDLGTTASKTGTQRFDYDVITRSGTFHVI